MGADDFLFFSEIHIRVVEGQSRQIFEFAVAAMSILIEVVGSKEPAIDYAHTWDTSSFDEVHKVPVTETEVSGRLTGGEHTIEMLQIMV